MSRGNLYIISAPSGAGKTSILRPLFRQLPQLAFSVSHTTRAPRSGEKDGVDYHFIDRDGFIAMRDQGAFLESAEVHGNFYGTSREAVLESLAAGVDIFLDIDVQGAAQVREKLPEAIAIFILPPSWLELEQRLRGRGTDSDATIALRLANARCEIAHWQQYDYPVINGDLDAAIDTLRCIVVAHRAAGRRAIDGTPLNMQVFNETP